MFFRDLRMEQEFTFDKRIDSDVEHELHMHDWLEINILLESKAQFRLLNCNYIGEPGDVFLFRPYEPHYNLAQSREKPIKWILVLFSPSVVRLIPGGYRLLYPFYTDIVSPHIDKASVYAQRIQASARQVIEDQLVRPPGWEAKRFMSFIDILLNIYCYTVEQTVNRAGVVVESGVIAAVEHILRHITEEIDVPALVARFGKSRTSFYNHFKSVVGVTPNHFINRQRMQIAKHLLNTSDKTVTDIAFDCGYNSLQYFHKRFREYEGIAPRAYRNRRTKQGEDVGES